MKPLTRIEEKTLELISSNAEKPTPCKYIASKLNISDRKVMNIINQLVYKGIPILGGRGVSGRKSGYYIPRTEQERQEGLRSFTNQIKEMIKRKEALEAIDLGNWMNNGDE